MTILALRIYDRRASPLLLMSLFPVSAIFFLHSSCMSIPKRVFLLLDSLFKTILMLWDLFCVIVVCHKNPFLEYRAARGLLSNASLGTVTLFLKPYSVSMPLIQSDPVASLPGTFLTYVCCCGTVITVLHLLTFLKCLFGMKKKRHMITLLLQLWT